tara:strand:+ start:90 stop:365 length:276 start_codon:yes stop_codon:yes gene_type:complete
MFLFDVTTMDVKGKQKFEAHFNYLGEAMTSAFEKANDTRKKEIGNYIKCLNEIYEYTNKLETKLIKQDYENDTTFRRKRVQQARLVKKNGR